ncbi:MAG: hypothetical protein KKA64_02580 [Nanoarchaeota archaeon]|nr:hypothetical protein [Nanoarchaeota archaeon]
MVLQFREKTKKSRWKDYSGKSKLKNSVGKYTFRLLSKDKKKVLVKPTNYTQALKRMRQIEFFKHRT